MIWKLGKYLVRSARWTIASAVSSIISFWAGLHYENGENYFRNEILGFGAKVYEAKLLQETAIKLFLSGKYSEANANFAKANIIFQNASDWGSPEAKIRLGYAYCTGKLGLPRDRDKGLNLIKSASEAQETIILQAGICDR